MRSYFGSPNDDFFLAIFSLRGIHTEDLRILKEKLQQEVSFAHFSSLAFKIIQFISLIQNMLSRLRLIVLSGLSVDSCDLLLIYLKIFI